MKAQRALVRWSGQEEVLSLPLELGTGVTGIQSPLLRRELGGPKVGRRFLRSQGESAGQWTPSCPLGTEVAELLRPILDLWGRPASSLASGVPALPPYTPRFPQRLPFFSSEEPRALISALPSHTWHPLLSLSPFYRWENGGTWGSQLDLRAHPAGWWWLEGFWL